MGVSRFVVGVLHHFVPSCAPLAMGLVLCDYAVNWNHLLLVTDEWISVKLDTDRKTDVLGEKLIPVSFCPPRPSWAQYQHLAARNRVPARRMTHLLLVTISQLKSTLFCTYFHADIQSDMSECIFTILSSFCILLYYKSWWGSRCRLSTHIAILLQNKCI